MPPVPDHPSARGCPCAYAFGRRRRLRFVAAVLLVAGAVDVVVLSQVVSGPWLLGVVDAAVPYVFGR